MLFFICPRHIDYDACDVTLSVYPHRESLKNMPDHGGNRTYDLWNTSPIRIPPWSGIFFKLARCGYTLRVTSQASYSPEYITPTQKNHIDYVFSLITDKTIKAVNLEFVLKRDQSLKQLVFYPTIALGLKSSP